MEQSTATTNGRGRYYEVQDLLRRAARLWVELAGEDAWDDYDVLLGMAKDACGEALQAANYDS